MNTNTLFGDGLANTDLNGVSYIILLTEEDYCLIFIGNIIFLLFLIS